ncbi:hypothetical protein ABZ532_21705 [Streptomyces sp. NPDC019396]|uniref:hypothetical protein n=1 Tax=Streptomyces sp. NPDC019396 TaxID=3154687 RepID=UPI0033D2D9CC
MPDRPIKDITLVEGLPVTTVDRTVCDLLKSRADAGRLIADADRKGLTENRTLAARVQPFARFYGLRRTASGDELLESLTEQASFTCATTS